MKLLITISALVGLIAAQCPSNDLYCGKCAGTVCSSCYASYLSGNSCVAPSTTVGYCATYLTKDICLTCNDGYYMTLSLKCEAITEAGCHEYNIIEKCTMCKNSIKPVNGACGSVACTDKNCASCDKNDYCDMCKSGYATDILTGKCITQATPDANCYAYHSGLGCVGCKFGYYDKNGTCTLSTAYKSVSIMVSAIVGVFGALLM